MRRVLFLLALILGGCGGGGSRGGFVFGDPDILAKNITYTKTTLQPGETTEASFDISNEGNQASSPMRVGVYSSIDNVITNADFLVQSIAIGALAPGEVQRVTLTVTAPSTPGVYFTAAFGDDRQDVSESREGNNISNILQITVQGGTPADLIASNYVVTSPTTISLGQGVNYSFQVINVGNTGAGTFRASIYESSSSTVTTANKLVVSHSLGPLASGGNVQIHGNFTPTATGTYFYAVIVDDQNAVTEGSESNNVSNAVQVKVQ